MLLENTIHLGDCLELMKEIPDASVDMILSDLPYGTTACKWDSVIPFKPLWEAYDRVIKPNGVIALTASQPLTSALVMSRIESFRYCWVWDKKIPSGMSYARYQPMRQHEDVLIFCKGKVPYNAQHTQREVPIKSGGMSKGEATNNPKWKPLKKTYTTKCPTTILSFDKVRKGSIHPTQKPVALFEYLIKTYTNPGDLVLDNCAGSGTTAVACKQTGRRFICIEKDPVYWEKAVKRISDAPMA